MIERELQDGVITGKWLAELNHVEIDRNIWFDAVSMERVTGCFKVARPRQPETSSVRKTHEFLNAGTPGWWGRCVPFPLGSWQSFATSRT